MSALKFLIGMQGSYVPISRTLVIPGGFTFRDFEAAILEAFEIFDSHRSSFFLPRRDIALTDNLDPVREGITGYRIMDCGRTVRTYVRDDIAYFNGYLEQWMFTLKFLGPDTGHREDYPVLVDHQGPSPGFSYYDPDDFFVFLRSYLDPNDECHDEVVEDAGEEGIPMPDAEIINECLREITAGSQGPNTGD